MDEILKLAAKYMTVDADNNSVMYGEHIEEFGKEAFNAGLEAAATTVCECVVTQMTGGLRKEFFDAIQKLEKK